MDENMNCNNAGRQYQASPARMTQAGVMTQNPVGQFQASPSLTPQAGGNMQQMGSGMIAAAPNTGMIPSTSSLPFSPFNLPQMQSAQPFTSLPSNTLQPLNPISQADRQIPESLSNPIYIPGFLQENIGRWMRVEFLIGNSLTDRVGILREVGASYILLQSIDPNSFILCDMFSIKFVVIINTDNYTSLYSDQ